MYFDISYEKLDDFAYIKNKNIFINDMHWLFLACVQKTGTPRKNVSFRKCDFWGLRLSLGYFGQQAPESSVSQLQNCVSTSSIPPFIVDLSTFKDYPRYNSFFQWEF